MIPVHTHLLHCLPQMLSLALLDAIVTFDREGRWLRFMVAKGYLQKLCASVQWEDEALQRMLLPSPEPLKALYVYESKMVCGRGHKLFVLGLVQCDVMLIVGIIIIGSLTPHILYCNAL